MPVSGARYGKNTQKTTDYIMTMNVDVENIDRNDKNTRITIYKSINAYYFGEVIISTKSFLYHCKNHPNDPQKNPNEINNNIKNHLR